ncbi:hypothetical protein N0V83_005010 [Neocucurbitaria cava]|uniref:Uncharacterized protein n=1 Tax=Neocucurbitaria cava TaxID=798079 RepID=A0A9W8Y9W8_9PLEO|nr:hypothetical protein N0V83_005010 [Neocucurbitaria cava]
MAPHQTAKISTVTSASQSTTCRGGRQVQSQVVKQVEELDEVEDALAMDTDSDAAVEMSETTQTKNGSLEQLVADMVGGQRRRHAKLKEGAGKAYNNSYKKVQDSINTVFDEHENEA